MASSKKKGKNKGKAKNNVPPAQKANKETYFLSDRIKQLPVGSCYTTFTKNEDEAFFVMFTREHINGNLAFAFIGMDTFTGEIIDCNFEFNFPRDLFEELIADLSLAQFGDTETMELLVYDAMVAHAEAGFSPVPNLQFAKNILQTDHETLKKSAHLRRLFGFQNSPEEVENLLNKQLELENAQNESILNYDPLYVKGWSSLDWSKFLAQIQGEAATKDFKDPALYNPLLFIFEHSLLPQRSISEKIMSDIDRLERSKPDLSASEMGTNNIDTSSEELLLQQSILMDMEVLDNKKNWPFLRKKCETFLDKYPDNEIIPFILYNIFRKLGYTNKAYKLIADCYKKMPFNQEAVVYYFESLAREYKPNLIKQFHSKGFLLEDHLPPSYRIRMGLYHYYYILVAQSLYIENHDNEAWRITQWFINMPSDQSKPWTENPWKSNYIIAVHKTFMWLTAKLVQEDEGQQLTEAITKISKEM